MAQADSNSTTHGAFVRTQTSSLCPVTDSAISIAAPASSHTESVDPIFSAIDQHREALDRRNRIIEEICAAEERNKSEESKAWHSYERAVIALLTTKPTTMAGVIAAMNYVALPESSAPGVCETILDGARLSSNREAAAAAEHFPALNADALRDITREHQEPPRLVTNGQANFEP
jgi:hypothetical protein